MATFTPLVFSCMGGMSRETQKYFNHLSEKICEKSKTPKYEMKYFIKTKLNLILIRSLTLYLGGTRTRQPNTELNMDDVSYIYTNSIVAQIP